MLEHFFHSFWDASVKSLEPDFRDTLYYILWLCSAALELQSLSTNFKKSQQICPRSAFRRTIKNNIQNIQKDVLFRVLGWVRKKTRLIRPTWCDPDYLGGIWKPFEYNFMFMKPTAIPYCTTSEQWCKYLLEISCSFMSTFYACKLCFSSRSQHKCSTALRWVNCCDFVAVMVAVFVKRCWKWPPQVSSCAHSTAQKM